MTKIALNPFVELQCIHGNTVRKMWPDYSVSDYICDECIRNKKNADV